ncbi:PPP4R2 [Teratosphaeria destructans]|uniref:PPP4R2 n=1 Tax=Teratosphaeria destructans TaxID=418781 RepID=A0A9W7SMA5_9PEZI|nr:PPP4R2 [Teratosphaeria destructans]
MASSEEILIQAAEDGSIDVSEWPRVLEDLLKRLHDIVYNDFPLPSVPLPSPIPASAIDPEVVASTPPPAQHATQPEAQHSDLPGPADSNEPPPNSQSSTKENDAPASAAASRPSVGFQLNHDQQPHDSIPNAPGTLPPDLLSMYQSCARILEKDFIQSPPYTIQRVAELVLQPKKHYRFLPQYLRALDRVVSVGSPVTDFPLPTQSATTNGSFLVNGDSHNNTITERDGLGSDESLGGALLTPIPWLRSNNNPLAGNTAAGSQEGELHSESTETIEGPNGAGSIETVSVTVNGISSTNTAIPQSNSTPASPTLSEQSDASTSSTESISGQQDAVTQGELLRQEQIHGVVPVNQMVPRRALISGGAVAAGRSESTTSSQVKSTGSVQNEDTEMEEKPEETPHARGPEEIGMADMGPQSKALGGRELDMEAAAGRAKSPPGQQAPVQVGSPPVTTQEQRPGGPPRAEVAQQLARQAAQDDAGQPGKDPQDAEKDVDQLKEAMDEDKKDEAKDADGDVVLADVDGRSAEEAAHAEATDASRAQVASDATTL